MKIWALGDLHLNVGVPEKSMEVFGPDWERYKERIEENWNKAIKNADLVLIPGDISWAQKTKDAQKDLDWIDRLPGKKVLIKGNHDHWWTSMGKLQEILPPSIQIIQNNALFINGIAIGGARLWDTDEYDFNEFIVFRENPRAKEKTEEDSQNQERLFQRELGRLRLSLEKMDPSATVRIAMTHYPPISHDLKPSRASEILEEFGIQYCVFGHLHNVRKKTLPFGEKNGVNYVFTSCDYVEFCPVFLTEV